MFVNAMSLPFVALVAISVALLTSAHPNDVRCTQQLTDGYVLMQTGNQADTSRTVKVSRVDGLVLNDGDVYQPGETLSFAVSDSSGGIEFLMEVDGAEIDGGTCSNTRMVGSGASTASVIMPTDASDVTFRYGWATGFMPVKLSPDFTLTGTAPDPTPEPTEAPSVSFEPTVTFRPTDPTMEPTSNPSSQPTETAVLAGAGTAPEDKRTALFAGIIIGFGVLALILFSDSFTDCSGTDEAKFRARLSGGPAIFFAIVSMAMVAAWATNNNPDVALDATGFLGTPRWNDSNVLAWHIVIAVGGFFTAQVFAINTFGMISNETTQKIMSVLWHSAALICLGVMLAAIKKYKHFQDTENYSNMHSWIGVGTALVYLLSYGYGLAMAIVTYFMDPNTSGKKPDAWIADKIYITLYLLAFGMTVTAILTGITNQVQFQCSYVNVDEILSPAAGYPHLPNSCKISLGMGLVVLGSAIFTVFTVVNRLPLASPNYSARGSLREHLDNDSAMSDKVSVDGVSIDGIVGPHKSASVSTKLGSWVPFEVVPFLSKFTWWSAILAVILGVFAIATVSAWATDKPVDYQYIGKATWSKNNLTLHIVMMVVGFFVAQLYAVAGWSLIQDRTTAKVSHIVLQSIAALFMIIGMAAVVKHKKDSGAFDLNTMHSWLGVCAVTIFGINYIFGVGMAYYTRVMVGRESEKIDLRPYHRPIGIIALVLTGIAILTGINEQTGTLTCTEGGVESLANGCKLAFSMGLFVLTSGICAIFAVFYRVMSLSSGQTAVASQTGGIVQSSIAGNVDVSKDTGINDVDSPMMDGLNA